MLKQRMRASAFWASLGITPQKIRQAVDGLAIAPTDAVRFVNRRSVRLAAVRLDLRRYSGLGDYVGHMSALIGRAAAEGAQLVAFPELTGLAALSLLPGFGGLLRACARLERTDENLRDAFRLAVQMFSGFVDEVFGLTFSGLAEAWRLPIDAGSSYTLDGGRIVNRRLLFGADGARIGSQDKLFLSDREHRLGVSPGERLGVFDTPVGRVALLTAQDALSFEPFWLAEALGADIAVAGADPLGEAPDAAGFRANENRLCVLSPGVSVNTAILRHSAPAAVRAPYAVTREGDGVVIEGGEAAVGRVDLERIAADFDVYSADRNPAFVRRCCGVPRD